MGDLRVDKKKRNSHMRSNNLSMAVIQSPSMRRKSMELLRREHRLKTLIKQDRQLREVDICRMGTADRVQLLGEE